VWHSLRYTCSIQRVGCSPRENRSYRRPANIPMCGTGSPVVYDEEDVTESRRASDGASPQFSYTTFGCRNVV
jgi:hypothetical protein